MKPRSSRFPSCPCFVMRGYIWDEVVVLSWRSCWWFRKFPCGLGYWKTLIRRWLGMKLKKTHIEGRWFRLCISGRDKRGCFAGGGVLWLKMVSCVLCTKYPSVMVNLTRLAHPRNAYLYSTKLKTVRGFHICHVADRRVLTVSTAVVLFHHVLKKTWRICSTNAVLYYRLVLVLVTLEPVGLTRLNVCVIGNQGVERLQRDTRWGRQRLFRVECRREQVSKGQPSYIFSLFLLQIIS